MTRSILVVDDDPLASAVAVEILREAGYQADQACDGRAATRWLGRNKADLMLVDMIMPEKDGIETILEARKRWPAMRIIAMSGGGARLEAGNLLAVARRLGADGVSLKPLDPAALLAEVAALMAPEAVGPAVA